MKVAITARGPGLEFPRITSYNVCYTKLLRVVTRPVARFRYCKELGQWSLQHCDDQERWRPYLNAGPSLNLGQLIVHVEQDPFGFFRDDPLPPEPA